MRISDLLGGASVAFHTIATGIENAGALILKAFGAEAGAMIQRDVSIAKQYASDAISYADGYLAQHQQAIAMAVEQQLDTELGLITRGASVPFNKFTNDGVDNLVAAAVAAAHNWGLDIKAQLAQPALTTAASTPTPPHMQQTDAAAPAPQLAAQAQG